MGEKAKPETAAIQADKTFDQLEKAFFDEKVAYLNELIEMFTENAKAADITGDISDIENWRDGFNYFLNLIYSKIDQHCVAKSEAFQIKMLIHCMVRNATTLASSGGPLSKDEISELMGDVKQVMARSAGLKSGEVRAQHAEDRWMSYALGLAKVARNNFPKGSYDKIASEIEDGWKRKGFDCPSRSRLKQVIAKWIGDGKLPKKS